MMKVKCVSKQTGNKIIQDRKPSGLFIMVNTKPYKHLYTAIDNDHGLAKTYMTSYLNQAYWWLEVGDPSLDLTGKDVE